MDRLAELLQESDHAVVFTGAGVSTLSGIRDFRGKNGIYKEFDPDRIFAIDQFLADPSYYYSHAGDFIYNLDEREPSLVHRQCARLERAGVIEAVITQNIDMLHQRAGSRNVFEIHGSPRTHRCLECGRDFDFAWVKLRVRRGEVPRCGCGGVIKPEITFFGEMLPEAAMRGAEKAARGADLMLVLGSSLVVHPAAGLPLLTVGGGGRLAIINDGETPLDRLAVWRHDDLEACFSRLEDAFGGFGGQ